MCKHGEFFAGSIWDVALTISADFATLPAPAGLPVLLSPPQITAGHVRVDVVRAAMPLPVEPEGTLVDRGVHSCPGEIELQIGEILNRLAHEPAYAFDFFVEPVDPGSLRLDVEVQRSRNGRRWRSTTIVNNCRLGKKQSANLQEVFGEKMRILLRFASSAPVHVWMRNPVLRSAQ